MSVDRRESEITCGGILAQGEDRLRLMIVQQPCFHMRCFRADSSAFRPNYGARKDPVNSRDYGIQILADIHKHLAVLSSHFLESGKCVLV